MPTSIRRGLPRVAGGEPWPPADAVVLDAAVDVADVAVLEVASTIDAVDSSQNVGAAVAHPQNVTNEVSTRPMRRGLPRVAGGEAWPTAGHLLTQTAGTEADEPLSASTISPSIPADADKLTQTAGAQPATSHIASVISSTPTDAAPLRRGLPRVAGGEPWPPAGTAARVASTPEILIPQTPEVDAPAPHPQGAPAEVVRTLAPIPFTRTAWQGEVPRIPPPPAAPPALIRGLTKLQWAGAVIGGGLALLVAAFLVVTITRWLVSVEWLSDFLTTYPGETHLPEGAPVGFPSWLGWQHFFNVFLMVLIIRSGLQVRGEKRPTMFWAPRNNPKGKISLALWFHQSLDILWITNGIIFIVLLFVSGQWMRVVPTSWEVFPNALSAVIQYISLDWPTENGWVNYNSIQVLAYFTTIFIAAPLAVVTGVRMSGIWPKKVTRLNALYPVEWARAIHFPVMLYFVAFIVVHVTLVFATGALRNLNHMYAAQGSVDPEAYALNWTGFWIFFASVVVIIGGWIAARPIVLAGIARAFGKVSGR